jgi:hypothetical protein
MFDLYLKSFYDPIDAAKAVFGKTAIRFADSSNDVQHAAVFYGRSHDGTLYIYTKNGWQIKPEIMKLSDLIHKLPKYGDVKGMSKGTSGFYLLR